MVLSVDACWYTQNIAKAIVAESQAPGIAPVFSTSWKNNEHESQKRSISSLYYFPLS